MDFSMDNIADLLGSLRPEDLESLKDAAQAMFGAAAPETNDSAPEPGIDPALMQKIMRVMGAMQSSHSERADLIRALQPYLSAPRQKRAQEAMQMLQLLDILPLLQSL